MNDTPDPTGIRALHLAAANQAPSFVDFLIKHGASVNIKARDHTTPLHHAAEALNKDTVEALLRDLPEEPERSCYDERLRTPIDRARSREKKEANAIIGLIRKENEENHGCSKVPISDPYALQRDNDPKDEDVQTLK